MPLQPDTQDVTLRLFRAITMFLVWLFLAWIGAWLLEEWLVSLFPVFSQGSYQFVYWLALKLVVWVVPALLVIRYTGRRFRDVMGDGHMRGMLVWGVGVGVILLGIAWGTKAVMGQSLFGFVDVWVLLGAVVVSPFVEEVVFRGAVLGALMMRWGFWASNVVTAVLFVGIHLPGWYFQGVLIQNMTMVWGGALSVFVLGVVFGYVAFRSRGVSGSILAHALNNLGNV